MQYPAVLVIMTACNQEVFPPAVIDSVTNQMDVYEAKDTAANCNSEIPRSMQVRPCLAKAPLGDALVSYSAELLLPDLVTYKITTP